MGTLCQTNTFGLAHCAKTVPRLCQTPGQPWHSLGTDLVNMFGTVAWHSAFLIMLLAQLLCQCSEHSLCLVMAFPVDETLTNLDDQIILKQSGRASLVRLI